MAEHDLHYSREFFLHPWTMLGINEEVGLVERFTYVLAEWTTFFSFVPTDESVGAVEVLRRLHRVSARGDVFGEFADPSVTRSVSRDQNESSTVDVPKSIDFS